MRKSILLVCLTLLCGCSISEIGTPRNNLDLSKALGTPPTSAVWVSCKPAGRHCPVGLNLFRSAPYFDKMRLAPDLASSDIAFDLEIVHSPAALGVISFLTLGIVPMYDQETYYLKAKVLCGGRTVKSFEYSRKFQVVSGLLGLLAPSTGVEANEGAGIGFHSPERMIREFLYDLQNGAMDEVTNTCARKA